MKTKNLKIFVVDRDEYTTNSYKLMLHEMGYKNVFTMSDAASCINNLVNKPDIIFLDYAVNTFLGLEVLKKIKRINPEIHVVILSEIDQLNDAIIALKLGAYDLILKGELEEDHFAMILENIESLIHHKDKKVTGLLQKVASFFW